jgi:hypothetical protein
MSISVAGLNPQAAFNEQPTNYGLTFMIPVTPTLTGANIPVVGNAVEIAAAVTYNPVGDGSYTSGLLYVKKSATTADFGVIGVCVGGSAPGSTPVAKGLCMVRVAGLARVYVNNTTVLKGPLIQTTTAGVLKYTATAVLGKTVGYALQVLTTPAAATLCFAWIWKS